MLPCLHIAYFCVHSLANLLYLRRKENAVQCQKNVISLRSHLAFVLTVVCLFCKVLQYLGLMDHLDLGHTAENIWIIKLEKEDQSICMHIHMYLKQLFQIISSKPLFIQINLFSPINSYSANPEFSTKKQSAEINFG